MFDKMLSNLKNRIFLSDKDINANFVNEAIHVYKVINGLPFTTERMVEGKKVKIEREKLEGLQLEEEIASANKSTAKPPASVDAKKDREIRKHDFNCLERR